MRTIVKIRNDKLYVGDEIFDLKEFLVEIDTELYRGDYLYQLFLDSQGKPSKFSIAKKLDKYKK